MACLFVKKHAARFFPVREKLKLESRRKLNLALTIQRAVSCRETSEIRIKAQNTSCACSYRPCRASSNLSCRRAGQKRVESGICSEYVSAVEYVEYFAQKFKIVFFGKFETFGDSRIQVSQTRKTEIISRNKRKTRVAARAVDARAGAGCGCYISVESST